MAEATDLKSVQCGFESHLIHFINKQTTNGVKVPATLDDIYARYEVDPAFTHLRRGSKQLVRGEGPNDPLVVFVGETPGAAEDNRGTPFIGRSGDYLNELLASVQIERSDVFLTNIVKYKPKENRDPTWGELMASIRYVHEELETLSCKVVSTLGRHALSAFFPEYQLRDVHGKILKGENDLYVIPLYHPAVALYNPSMVEKIEKDFQSIGEAVDMVNGSTKETV